jgi:hypothetical protein
VKNQFAPLSHIQRWLGSDEPLFDTLFVYQKFTLDAVGTDGWDIIDEETNIDVSRTSRQNLASVYGPKAVGWNPQYAWALAL